MGNSRRALISVGAVAIVVIAVIAGVMSMTSHSTKNAKQAGVSSPKTVKLHNEDGWLYGDAPATKYSDITPSNPQKVMDKYLSYATKHSDIQKSYEAGNGTEGPKLIVFLYRSDCPDCLKVEAKFMQNLSTAYLDSDTGFNRGKSSTYVLAMDIKEGVPSWFKKSVNQSVLTDGQGRYPTPTVATYQLAGLVQDKNADKYDSHWYNVPLYHYSGTELGELDAWSVNYDRPLSEIEKNPTQYLGDTTYQVAQK